MQISRMLLETEAWFQRTTNRKWPMASQMVTWPLRGTNIQGRPTRYENVCSIRRI